jgi:hypothetical protein
MCVIYVLCLIVVSLPSDENPFGIKINNNYNNTVGSQMAARLSALRAGRTLPPDFFIFKDSWYSFLLEAELIPGPWCGWNDCMN